jgi:hypothetical protein
LWAYRSVPERLGLWGVDARPSAHPVDQARPADLRTKSQARWGNWLRHVLDDPVPSEFSLEQLDELSSGRHEHLGCTGGRKSPVAEDLLVLLLPGDEPSSQCSRDPHLGKVEGGGSRIPKRTGAGPSLDPDPRPRPVSDDEIPGLIHDCRLDRLPVIRMIVTLRGEPDEHSKIPRFPKSVVQVAPDPDGSLVGTPLTGQDLTGDVTGERPQRLLLVTGGDSQFLQAWRSAGLSNPRTRASVANPGNSSEGWSPSAIRMAATSRGSRLT